MATNMLSPIPSVVAITLLDMDPDKPFTVSGSDSLPPLLRGSDTQLPQNRYTELELLEIERVFFRQLKTLFPNHAYDVVVKLGIRNGFLHLQDIYLGKHAAKELQSTQLASGGWIGNAGLRTLYERVAHLEGIHGKISAGSPPDSFASRVTRSSNTALGL